ncbi:MULTISPECIES: hypothetical protein [unclassified Enterobacter cloacae complex]|uniref:hypothetical protein n=1 Tax=Enterobacter cloacae complex TaxID=354276 RepID=UPI001872A453|nr:MULTISPECIES: hypothetical protein [unclassified Enterobacter cloacae complex]MBE4887278.1 hypothetical protein [Enterobacter cloacae complex sp. P37RS]MBE7431527.1 hypothetical protein [Enterobacter cloacae complex sp. P36RS]MCE1476573.1 hypothetical protein [Enterobacter hormaechei]
MKRLIIAAALMAVSTGVMADTFQCSGHGFSSQVETTYSGLSQIRINGVFVKPAQGALRNDNGTNQQLYESSYPMVDGRKLYTVIYSDSGEIYNIGDNTADLEAGKTHWTAQELQNKMEVCPAWAAHIEADKQQRKEAARAAKAAKQQEQEQAKIRAILEKAEREGREQAAKEEAAKTW